MKLSERGTGRVTEGLEADERECTGVSATGDERECAGAKQAFGGLLVVTAALGLLGSLVITIDKFELLADPDFVPACSLSPVVSCTSVMRSEQASAFGFPNPLIGLVAFGTVLGTGAGLLAGARYRLWYWLGLNFGTLFGTGFCMWLMTQAGLVAPVPDEDVQHVAVLVDRAPEVLLLVVDRDEDLVKMPLVAGAGTSAAQRVGVGLPELQTPPADRLVGHDDAALQHQLLHLTE
ncbi:hypothetical protein GCM10009647_070800 [Streptomyces sanglieri]